MPSVIQTRKWEDVLAQRTNGKRSTTDGTCSLVGVSGSMNMCSHAGPAVEVAYVEFDEDKAFPARLNTTRVSGLPQGVTRGVTELSCILCFKLSWVAVKQWVDKRQYSALRSVNIKYLVATDER